MSNIIAHKIKKYKNKLNHTNDEEKRNLYSEKLHYYQQQGGTKDKLMLPKPGIPKDYNLNDYLGGDKILAIGYGIFKVNTDLEPVHFERRVPKNKDVLIKIQYGGVCRSDWHEIIGEWESDFPLVPGHEIAGTVIDIGPKTTKYNKGDKVLVAAVINSCGKCKRCKEHREQYCENGATWAYNSREREPGDVEPSGAKTFGGWSNTIVVDEDFVYNLPKNLPMDKTSPLVDAGLTVFSPMKQYGVGPGTRVAVAGIGGLGHCAIKIAKAMGAKVTALTTSKWKVDDSKKIGADDSVLVTKKSNLDEYKESFDLIIDTIPEEHDLNMYLKLLAFNGVHWMVGYFDELPYDTGLMASMNRSIRGSVTGGTVEMKELLELCSKHRIVCEIEKIPIQDINKTYDRLVKKNVRYRFVIDIENSL